MPGDVSRRPPRPRRGGRRPPGHHRHPARRRPRLRRQPRDGRDAGPRPPGRRGPGLRRRPRPQRGHPALARQHPDRPLPVPARGARQQRLRPAGDGADARHPAQAGRLRHRRLRRPPIRWTRGFGLDHGFDVYDDQLSRAARNPTEFVIAERRGDQVVAAGPRLVAVPSAASAASSGSTSTIRTPPTIRRSRSPAATATKPYLGEVAATDSFLAPLLEPFLDGKEPPALVVVTADHGEALGDHGELTHGLFAYEATLKVPLVVWGAGRRARAGTSAAGAARRHRAHGARRAAARIPGGAARPLAAGSRRRPARRAYFEALSHQPEPRLGAAARRAPRAAASRSTCRCPSSTTCPSDPRERATSSPRSGGRRAPCAAPCPRSRSGRRRKGSGLARGGGAPAQPRLLRRAAARGEGGLHGGGRSQEPGRARPQAPPGGRALLPRPLRGGRRAWRARWSPSGPSWPRPTSTLALALRQLERHGEAIEVLRSAPAGAAAAGESLRRQLGLALAETGRAARGGRGPAAASPRPATPPPSNALGIALSDAGRHAEGVAVLQRACRGDPEDPKATRTWASSLLRMDRPAEARDQLRAGARAQRPSCRSPGTRWAWRSTSSKGRPRRSTPGSAPWRSTRGSTTRSTTSGWSPARPAGAPRRARPSRQFVAHRAAAALRAPTSSKARQILRGARRMTRRSSLVLAAPCSSCSPPAAAAGGERRGRTFHKAPVILISIDTLRSDHLPAYGYSKVETPAIDALRQRRDPLRARLQPLCR